GSDAELNTPPAQMRAAPFRFLISCLSLSEQAMTATGRRRVLERVATRDERVPLSADDPEMWRGWRNIPVPPSDDPTWFILDYSSNDKSTEWGRWHDVEGSA